MTLQAALPRAMYVDARPLVARARGRPVRRVVLRRTASTELGLERAGAAGGRRRGGRVGARDDATSTARCTRRTTSAVTAGRQLVPVGPGADACVRCAARSLRCPYHSWTYALDGTAAAAPHAEDLDDPPSSACTRSAVDEWGGFVFVHLTPDEAAPLARRGRRTPRRAGPLPARPAGDRARRFATTWPPTTRCCWRTTTSATTAGRCTPS